MWAVYIVRCADNTLYTGIARDVESRLAQHNSGKAAKYTRSRLPVELVFREDAADRSAALKLTGVWPIDLIGDFRSVKSSELECLRTAYGGQGTRIYSSPALRRRNMIRSRCSDSLKQKKTGARSATT